MARAVKPRLHLVLDICLFATFVVLLIAIIVQLIFAHSERSHLHVVLGYIHGVAGVLMTLLAGIHLYWHLPWITVQLKTMLRQKGGQTPHHSAP